MTHIPLPAAATPPNTEHTDLTNITSLAPFTQGMDYAEKREERRARVLALSRDALAHLCPILSDCGVRTVAIVYDGGGDEGQIERVDALGADVAIELPDVPALERGLEFDGTTYVNDTTLVKALETFGYEILEAVHDGWEINDGAYGELTIDVAALTASLEHSTRYIAVETDTLELGEAACPTPTTTH